MYFPNRLSSLFLNWLKSETIYWLHIDIYQPGFVLDWMNVRVIFIFSFPYTSLYNYRMSSMPKRTAAANLQLSVSKWHVSKFYFFHTTTKVYGYQNEVFIFRVLHFRWLNWNTCLPLLQTSHLQYYICSVLQHRFLVYHTWRRHFPICGWASISNFPLLIHIILWITVF